MFNKREDEIKKAGITLLRLLVAVTMVQYLFAGTLLTRAATVAEVDTVTGFNLLQSADGTTWNDVPGDLGGGFTMTLDPTVSFYYLNVDSLEVTPLPEVGYHPFIVSTTPAGFFEYWAGRGVCEGCGGTWEPVMWEIINGRQPIFYLKVAAGPSYMLVDGLTRDTGGPDVFLRVNGDYLPGDYTFTGTITDTEGTPSQLPVDITFELIERKLTVDTDGSGSGTVTSNPAGIDCGLTCSQNFDHGTVVTLTATADPGSSFSGWAGDLTGSTNPITITMDASKAATATFTQDEYSLTVNIVGNGTVGKLPDQPNYLYGDVVTLTAAADLGWSFFGWDGDLAGNTNPITITMDASKIITATFTQDEYILTVNIVGNGSVSKLPDQPDYHYGEVVTLTASTDPGWNLFGWSGDLGGSSNPITITMDASKTVTATFTQDEYILTVNIVGNGSVSKLPDQPDYHYGDVVTLTATADPGWSFFGWEGDLGGSTNPITITMDVNKSVTAVFKQYHVFLPVVWRDPVFADDFNYADPNQVWVKWEQIEEASATWFVQANEFHGKHIVTDRNAKAAARVYAPQMPGSYSVETKVKLESGSVEGARCGLLFDFLDNTHTYRFVIMPGLTSGDNWLVQERNPTESRWDTLPGGSGRATMLSRNEYNLLRVVRQGASIKVYLNDMLTPLWSGSDSTFVNGRAGLNIGTPVGLATGTYVEVIFDDFLIDSLR